MYGRGKMKQEKLQYHPHQGNSDPNSMRTSCSNANDQKDKKEMEMQEMKGISLVTDYTNML